MDQELRVRFGTAQHGWLPLEIVTSSERLESVVSAVPNDFLAEMTGALIAFVSGVTRAEFMIHMEPEEAELILSSEAGQERLEIKWCSDHRRQAERSEVLCLFCSKREELVRPFWKALRELEGRIDVEEFARHWRHPFPSQQVERLSRSCNR